MYENNRNDLTFIHSFKGTGTQMIAYSVTGCKPVSSLKNVSSKIFLAFWPSKNFFFSLRNIPETGKESRIRERLMMSSDVSCLAKPLLPILVTALCFVKYRCR